MTTQLSDNLNFFQPTGFRVAIDRQNYANFQFFVQSITHPSLSNPAVEVAYQRVQGVPMPGNSFQYGELQMDVLIDEDFRTYLEIYNWMVIHINESQMKNRDNWHGGSNEQTTAADISVTALTNLNNKNRIFKYRDCLPTSIGDIRFEAQNAGVDFYTFPATFRFTYFEIE